MKKKKNPPVKCLKYLSFGASVTKQILYLNTFKASISASISSSNYSEGKCRLGLLKSSSESISE
jgi:hypothetical protein